MTDILQVVDGDGDFNVSGVQNFVRESGVESAGVDYTVVAIMGPQSSGKSTLLNHLFGTKFEEMDALTGRCQTTKGIWLARSPKVMAPSTLVMDLEGSDGRERGEDDTSFERQSALFALATADILLINMWAKDVGREAGAGKPLLKTIFQVNLKLFQPSPGARRTVLLFVLRDRTKTPLEKLKETWEADLEKMWQSIAKPPAYEDSRFIDFFEIQYAALVNYEDFPDDFAAETTLLRRRFTHDADDNECLLRQAASKLPGQALALSMSKVWEVIHANKDLNLPAHRVMVANIRCDELANDQLAAFESSDAWQSLMSSAQEDIVPTFGSKVANLLDGIVSGYDAEARYFDAGVSAARLEKLTQDLHELIKPVFESQMSIASALALESFKMKMDNDGRSGAADEAFTARSAKWTASALSEFDTLASDIVIPGVEWTATRAREALHRELVAHHHALRSRHLGNALSQAEDTVASGVSAGSMPLLENPPVDLWRRLEAVVDREVTSAAAVLSAALQGYGVNAAEEGEMRSKVRAAARACLLSNAKEAANTALPRIKDRFSEVFQKDQGMPRTWSPAVDIPTVVIESKRASAFLLSQLTIVKLSGQNDGKSMSAVESAILRLAEPERKSSDKELDSASFDLLSISEWPNVPKEDVLLSPAQIRTVWRQFASDIALSVQQASATQEANRLAQNRLPPVWAIIAMIFLGFNEAVTVLRNPLLLIFLLVVFLFCKTVYNELDVEGEMSRGLLPGLMTISSKFVPTVQRVVHKTFESLKTMLQDGPTSSTENGEHAIAASASSTTSSTTFTGRHAHTTLDNGNDLRARKKEIGMTAIASPGVSGDVVHSRKDQ